MNIRIIESKDARIIAEINKTVQDIHELKYPKYFKTYNGKAVGEGIRTTVHDDNWYSYIAYADDTPAGYALFFIRHYEENPFRHSYKGFHVDQICVRNEYQRMNIGARLLEAIEEFAMMNMMDQIELTYWEKNIHAKSFYRKHGFEKMMQFTVKRLK